jgi:hypothetical protein
MALLRALNISGAFGCTVYKAHVQQLFENCKIFFNLLRSYLIKGLAVPLVGIKYPTISTNLLKHLNIKQGK